VFSVELSFIAVLNRRHGEELAEFWER